MDRRAADPNSYSIKEFITEKFNEVNEALTRIETQAIKTNGRVTGLERHKSYLWGAFSMLTLLGATIIFLAVQAIDYKIKNGIRDELASYEVTDVSGVELQAK